MDLSKLEKINPTAWRIPQAGTMRVPGIIYGSERLLSQMDDKVCEQLSNVATLPGIVKAAYAMPDAHWGYGFPIGGVAAFDPDDGGIVSAGGVGFDISCGVRLLRSNLDFKDLEPIMEALAESLFERIPAGLGSRAKSRFIVEEKTIDEILTEGAAWAVAEGFGFPDDLEFTEERGLMLGARPDQVSPRAKARQFDEMGTLGSGNHYLEVQVVDEIFDDAVAKSFQITQNQIVISIHCGSRGLGHQIGSEYLKLMVLAASAHGITFPDRELACAPINSDLGQAYLGAMRAAINCALCNRQMITHYVRRAFTDLILASRLSVLYDVSHNTCKVEDHIVEGRRRSLFVHRKGATRSLGSHASQIALPYAATGQPVIIGGSMGTSSYLLVGIDSSEEASFSSSCHGAGRSLSRHAAKKLWSGRRLVSDLAEKGILIHARSFAGVAEEAPGSYKSIDEVVDNAESAGLSKKVARLRPLICIKG